VVWASGWDFFLEGKDRGFGQKKGIKKGLDVSGFQELIRDSND